MKRRVSKVVRNVGWAGFFSAVVVSLGLVYLWTSSADSPDPGLLGDVRPQKSQRGFIAVPDAGALSIQNISDASADITVEYYTADGELMETETITDTLSPESMELYPDVEEDQDVALVRYVYPSDQIPPFGVNFELDRLGNDAYQGLLFEEDARVSFGPEPFRVCVPYALCNGPWYTKFTVQNRGQADAAVVVAFFRQDGSLAGSPYVATIPPRGSMVVDLRTTSLPEGFVGSAVISSDQLIEVAGSVRTYSDALKIRSAYQAVEAGDFSTELVAPALFKGSDMQTSQICVQNVGTTTADVRVTCSDGIVQSRDVQPFAVHCFDQEREGHASGWAGGAVITSGSPLVAIVNVWAGDEYQPAGRWSYTVPARYKAGRTLAFPVLFNEAELRASAGAEALRWTSDIYLYNFNNAPATVTPRYVSFPSGFVYCARPFTIPANSVRVLSQSELPEFMDASMAYFSATQPLAAAVGVTSDNPLGTTDRHFGYGAGYLDTEIDFPDTCNPVAKILVPAVLNQTQ